MSMKELNYQIEFFSEWHCGSGLTAGADIDALVIKDSDGVPFIPGKTLKGLIREAFEDYVSFSNADNDSDALFGTRPESGALPSKGLLYFTDAALDPSEHLAITANKVQEHMYQKRTQTAIDENGIAKGHSLRSIETVVPCTLKATIMNVPETAFDTLVKSLGMIKRMGVNRNRGLGRCLFSIIKKGGSQ